MAISIYITERSFYFLHVVHSSVPWYGTHLTITHALSQRHSFKVQSHYSSHVVLHTVRVYAQEKWINAKQKSTKEQSGKKQRRLSSETASKILISCEMYKELKPYLQRMQNYYLSPTYANLSFVGFFKRSPLRLELTRVKTINTSFTFLSVILIFVSTVPVVKLFDNITQYQHLELIAKYSQGRRYF